MLIKSNPFGLSLSKPLFLQMVPFDKLRVNGINQRFLSGSRTTRYWQTAQTTQAISRHPFPVLPRRPDACLFPYGVHQLT